MIRQRWSQALAAAIIAASIFAWSPVAAGDATAAEELFRQGRVEFDAGRFDAACEKLSRSLELDRAIGTMWYLARCFEETGEYRDAWRLFREVQKFAGAAGRTRQERAARARADGLEPRLCRLRLTLDTKGLPMVLVRLDGERLPRSQWGRDRVVDCGEHTLAVLNGASESRKVVVVDSPGEVVEHVAEIPEPPPIENAPRSPRPTPGWYADPIAWALVAAGTGAAVTSGLFHLRARAKEDDARRDGLDLAVRDGLFDEADSARIFSFVAGGAAAALLTAGIVKLAFVPDAAATIAPTDGGASARLVLRF